MAEAAVAEIVATLTQPAVAAIENVVADLAIQTALNVTGVQDGYRTDQTVKAGVEGLRLNSADGPTGPVPGGDLEIDHDAHGSTGMHLANVQVSMRARRKPRSVKPKGPTAGRGERTLSRLTEGYAPHRIAPRRWAWAAPHAYEEPLGNAVRTALVAVYVLHHRKVFSARELRLTITTLRGIGQETLDRLVALPRGSLQDSAVPLVARMRALMAAEGVIPQGAELKITVAAPEGTRSPGASVSCAVRVGHSATEPAEAELSLSAGAGAVVGRPWAAVRGCAEDLARYGRARGRSDQVPVFPASTGPPF
ncbi:hypothetical protein [Streptomyces sp. NPDC056937]|uniref:hypothetical protein n=1 Tax=Streptomyces sp. NPDC056937 TaxID=3345969 RepID=UPI003636A4A0